MKSKDLAEWNAISSSIEKAKTIQDMNSVRAKIEAIRVLSKQSKAGLDSQNKIAEFRLRIDRKRGIWIKENIAKGGNGSNQHIKQTSNHFTLAEAKIGRMESSILQRIARIPEREFDKFIEATIEQKAELTTTSLMELEAQLRYINRKTPPLPKGKFDLLYVDPPYSFDLRYRHIKEVSDYYPTMSIEEICAMGKDIRALSAHHCTLFLWIPSALLPAFPEILKAWGFEYRTCWIWAKGRYHLSHYGSSDHEIIIIGGKGKATPDCDPKVAATVSSVQSIPKSRRHSEKPKEYYGIIEKLYPGRKYLELFSREKEPRPGWTHWGDEVPGTRG